MRTLITMALLCLCVTVHGGPKNKAKKAISQARDWVKSGKNLDKAEASMLTLLTDSDQHDNPKVWLTLLDALRKQYEQGNEQLYLKQKVDTARLFDVTLRLFRQMQAFDSIDAKPNSKGKVEPTYRKDHAQWLHLVRPNLYNGGLFFIRKQNVQAAYPYFEQYVNTMKQPLFSAHRYEERDTLLPHAAYWATYCAWKMKDVTRVLEHRDLALKDVSHREMLLQYLADTYRLSNDSSLYVKTLEEGFECFPRSPFFFSRLMEHFSALGEWTKALQLANRAQEADSTSALVQLAKSTVLLNMEKWEEAFTLSAPLTQLGDTLPEAWLNAGLAKYNEGVVTLLSPRPNRAKQQRQACYRAALPYLEHYRSLCPTDKEKWGVPLYTIYLDLNMGKEFDEIDKILK